MTSAWEEPFFFDLDDLPFSMELSCEWERLEIGGGAGRLRVGLMTGWRKGKGRRNKEATERVDIRSHRQRHSTLDTHGGSSV